MRNLRRSAAAPPFARWVLQFLCLVTLGCRDSPAADGGTPPTLAASSGRPNIILILIDTLRADHLGSYGFVGPISPNLDRFAAEAIQFDQCFSQAPWTKPAIATLFTGLDPGAHQVLTHQGHLGNPKSFRASSVLRTDVLQAELRTLAEELRDAGYTTGAVVVNPWLGREQGFAQGFDHYEDRLRGNEVEATAVLERANTWLARRRPDRPFFLYLHFMDVHSPYDASEADVDAIRSSPSLGEEQSLERANLAPGMLEYPKHPKADWARTPAFLELREWRARYAGGVHGLDRALGGFLDRLRADGTLDNSLVVVTSDHGEELFDHSDWAHGKNLYDHQLRVPLLVRNPGGVHGGRRLGSLVALADVMPTLVAVGGGKVRGELFGRDLGPMLRGDAGTAVHATVFATGVKWKPSEHAARTLGHKLIVDLEGAPARLFDVTADSLESRDVAAAQAATLGELRQRLELHLGAVRQQAIAVTESAELPADAVERLRALGYLNEEKKP